ncbi:hypothetical protein [Streptomyces orinoci]|uniref:Uncharacterized protein n=1 Tax=Streptomyces orinoci TaxID=67339 RepID=A0ABV3JZB5_STRON|nr:hypothetical protein [Streptomyces orinoci]
MSSANRAQHARTNRQVTPSSSRGAGHLADLVTFTAQSGGVVWLGRTKTGDVAAIVVTSGMAGAKA